jgi:hypothetical protein
MVSLKRLCLDCGKVSSGSRCPKHKRLREIVKDAKRGGHSDWRDRARAVEAHVRQHGQRCPGFGVPPHSVTEGNRLTADHPVPLALGGPLHPGRYNVLCHRCQGRQGAALARYLGGHRS